MPDIVLSTLNAKFIHASFGLRYLFANLGELQGRTELLEFEIKQTPLEIVEAILAHRPRVLGLGIYIWNARPSLDVVRLLKRLRPELRIVLGGPEVSHEWEDQEIVGLADHLITGEGDLAFRDLCRRLLDPDPRSEPPPKVLAGGLPDLATLELPYHHYSDTDLAHRLLYVEASRGCPFSCEFCLSSLDLPVRQFPLDRFLAALTELLDRGARQFKFVDRTFNLNLATSRAILRFFRQRWREGMFLHFEMIPDRLPDALREELAWFPAGAVQLEIGIQSFNEEVCQRIHRRQDQARTTDNLLFLRQSTGVHLHTDLIAGLPGETLESFAAGFDRLLALNPQEIQFGILKRLRGTPIVRHDAEWGMRYSPVPPYEILESQTLDFPTLQRMRRFARYWDLVANSGRFGATLPLIWSGSDSPFWSFLRWSDWLYAQVRQTSAIALDRLAHHLFRWLTTSHPEGAGVDSATAATALASDWHRSGQRDLPPWLLPLAPRASTPPAPTTSFDTSRRTARRQERHLTNAMPPTQAMGSD
ncbi:MAG: B12-binding domain-containing radical SAM protein, partial [Verrucomicrobiales bacterium]|nr:B12-binding domain-containing radical SAM protein [Verrucomicrobiales bacterium]